METKEPAAQILSGCIPEAPFRQLVVIRRTFSERFIKTCHFGLDTSKRSDHERVKDLKRESQTSTPRGSCANHMARHIPVVRMAAADENRRAFFHFIHFHNRLCSRFWTSRTSRHFCCDEPLKFCASSFLNSVCGRTRTATNLVPGRNTLGRTVCGSSSRTRVAFSRLARLPMDHVVSNWPGFLPNSLYWMKIPSSLSCGFHR
jgi:hypothetical protein